MNLLAVFIGLAIANFGVQYFKLDPDYLVALERSYFQGVGFLTYWICSKFVWGEK